MSSLRLRLFLLMLAATGAVWLSAIAWIQFSTRAEVERVLDARLREAAQMVSSLVADRRIDVASAARMATSPAPAGAGDAYTRQLSCQIWSLDGELVARSEHAPASRLADTGSGFSESLVGGEVWRVYSVVDPALGIRVMVGDNLSVRERLVEDVTTGFLLPALLVLPALAGLIWITVGRGLLPLRRIATGIAARPASDLQPLSVMPAPREIRPIALALNDLLRRLGAARDAERSFIAYAAHELKTPLAGLRTQAQIARMAGDAETRRQALERLEAGVVRTDRMVRQLLALATVETEVPDEQEQPVPLDALVREVADDLRPAASARGIALEVRAGRSAPRVARGRALLAVALRNLVENAVEASSPGQAVEIALEGRAARWRIAVLDRGRGIPPAERERIRERFYRATNAPAGGSGLGLAIAAEAVQQLGGRLEHRPRPGGGEIAELTVEFASDPRDPVAAGAAEHSTPNGVSQG